MDIKNAIGCKQTGDFQCVGVNIGIVFELVVFGLDNGLRLEKTFVETKIRE